MKITKIALLVVLVLCLTSISSCAPVGYAEEKSGFWCGVWDGSTIIFAIIGKIFDIGKNTDIYADNNTGFTYWLGFILALLSGGDAYRRNH